jgi:hypothetical protein
MVLKRFAAAAEAAAACSLTAQQVTAQKMTAAELLTAGPQHVAAAVHAGLHCCCRQLLYRGPGQLQHQPQDTLEEYLLCQVSQHHHCHLANRHRLPHSPALTGTKPGCSAELTKSPACYSGLSATHILLLLLLLLRLALLQPTLLLLLLLLLLVLVLLLLVLLQLTLPIFLPAHHYQPAPAALLAAHCQLVQLRLLRSLSLQQPST